MNRAAIALLFILSVAEQVCGQNMEHMEHMSMRMPSAFSLNLPMTRNGSGTSWLPDASPMYGYMVHAGDWMFMFHGDIFPRYNHQDLSRKGSRGGEKWDAPDMLMAMGQRKMDITGRTLRT